MPRAARTLASTYALHAEGCGLAKASASRTFFTAPGFGQGALPAARLHAPIAHALLYIHTRTGPSIETATGRTNAHLGFANKMTMEVWGGTSCPPAAADR